MIIENLSISDISAIEWIYMSAFPRDEALSVFNLINNLVINTSAPSTLNIGFTVSNKLIAAASFSPVYFHQKTNLSGYILAPLAVHPDYQKQGYATTLIRHAKKTLRANGVNVLMVYGDPNYYSRHGFNAKLATKFTPPHPLEFKHGWLATLLSSDTLIDREYEFSCVPSLSDPEYW